MKKKIMKLAERLYILRKERKLTQENVAKLLDIAIATYCRYERGEREPTVSILIRIAQFYHVSLDYLVGLKEKRT